MIKEAGYVSNSLLSTGFPENWSSLNINQTLAIGLLDSSGLLDKNKIDTFRDWASSPENYDLSKRKINTRYDYQIIFYDGEKNPFDSIGLAPNNAKQIVKIQRLY